MPGPGIGGAPAEPLGLRGVARRPRRWRLRDGRRPIGLREDHLLAHPARPAASGISAAAHPRDRSTASRIASATSRFDCSGRICGVPSRPSERHPVGVVLEAGARLQRVVDHDEIEVLPLQLREALGHRVSRLQREAHDDAAGLPRLAGAAQDVRRWAPSESPARRPPRLRLLALGSLGRKSAGAAAITSTSAAGSSAPDRRFQLAGALDPPERRPRSAAAARPGPEMSTTSAPRSQADLGHAIPHLAAGAVGDDPHRIDRLAGGPRGHHDPPAGELAAAAKHPRRVGQDGLRLAHAARPLRRAPRRARRSPVRRWRRRASAAAPGWPGSRRRRTSRRSSRGRAAPARCGRAAAR